MRKTAGIVAGVLLSIVLLSGCDEPEDVKGKDNADNPENQGQLNGSFQVGTVTINGKRIMCVSMVRPYGNATYGGMSCDFAGDVVPVTDAEKFTTE